MAKQSFLLVSLQEDKAKKLAQVVSNESCRKILDYLTEKESTETELAGKLQLPISTVHYNLKQLEDAGLVSAEEFHYSKKGKEVKHYKLANKYIIIAPKSTFGIKEKLKNILPAAVAVAAVGFVMQFISRYQPAPEAYAIASRELAQDAIASKMAVEATLAQPNIYIWFLIGALMMIAFYIAIEYIRYRKINGGLKWKKQAI
ncbi:helix-turn-helix transcriptional regulator [Candidatus Woesearchaeota archaeon]|nr:helix-turn-helix transcriptional regulator [Candidatus Woesearchaeota archaeon]